MLLSISILLLSSCIITDSQTPYRSEISHRFLLLDAGEFSIPAILTLPKGGTACPVVIMEHGTGSQKDEARDVYKMLSLSLADKRIASLRFDFPGCGESSESSLLYDNIEAVRETKIVTEYLSNLKEIDKNRIGLLGWSQGGGDVLLAAGDCDTYKSVATWAGALNCGLFISKEKREEANTTGQTTVEFKWREPFPLSKQWIDQADSMDILEYVSKINAPIASFHGTIDNIVNFSDSEKVQAISIND